MPSKHTIRSFFDGGYYHIFNRGVAKQDIYLDKQDYAVFLYYLKSFLSDPELLDKQDPFYDSRRLSFHGKVELICYCLMPNHYHLFVTQLEDQGISDFMRALSNAYTKYFNNKYDRVGPIFQGRFKAAGVYSDMHFMHLSRYIHQNPIDLGKDILGYDYSSCRYFLTEDDSPSWLNINHTMDLFHSTEEYRQFLLQKRIKSKDILEDESID